MDHRNDVVLAPDVLGSAITLRLARAWAPQWQRHETVASGAEAAAQIRELTHGLGAQLVLDFVGAEPTLRLAVQVAPP